MKIFTQISKYAFLPSILLMLISCKKTKEVFTPEINISINTQTAAMTTLYDLIHMHIVTAEGGSFYTDNCYDRSADTIGTTVFDTMSMNIREYCFPLKENISSGSYTSEYSTSFPSILDTAVIRLNFKSNGVTLRGEIRYFYQTLSLIRVVIQDMEVTDPDGNISYLDSDLFLYMNSETSEFTGNMNFTGAHNFSWKALTSLSGPNDFDFSNSSVLHEFYLRSGTAEFEFSDTKMVENFGNGEEDNLATISDETGERLILVLPRL